MAVPITLQVPAPDCTSWRHALDVLADGEVASRCAARAYKRVLRRTGDSARAPKESRDAVMASLRGVRGSRTN